MTLAQDLVDLVDKLAADDPDADDEELAELAFPHVVGMLLSAMRPNDAKRLFAEMGEALLQGAWAPAAGAGLRPPAPPAVTVAPRAATPYPPTPWCHRPGCMGRKLARWLVWDERTGTHRPVCEEHARPYTPFERRAIDAA
jgi:hypothetical protein